MIIDLITTLDKSKIIFHDFYRVLKAKKLPYYIYYNNEYDVKYTIKWGLHIISNNNSIEYLDICTTQMICNITSKNGEFDSFNMDDVEGFNLNYFDVIITNKKSINFGEKQQIYIYNVVVDFGTKKIYLTLKQ
tara:strand:+ start:1071 stop:1469 length:399 start_codon:yes stop_codon:yes gene_type:complete